MSVFLKAIDVINELGWGQGEYMAMTDDGKYIPKGPVCLVGACTIAADIRDITGSLAPGRFESLNEYKLLEMAIDSSKGFVSNYNDLPTTTLKDVIQALRKAHEYECALQKQIEHSSVQPA